MRTVGFYFGEDACGSAAAAEGKGGKKKGREEKGCTGTGRRSRPMAGECLNLHQSVSVLLVSCACFSHRPSGLLRSRPLEFGTVITH
jgi:hypothetical protein